MCFSFRHHRTLLTYHAYPVCRCSPGVNARRALPLFHCVERQGTSSGFVLTDSNNNLNGGSATRVRGKLHQPSRASSGMAENHGSAGIIKKAAMASSAAPVGQTKAEARPPPSGPESLHRHVGGGPAGKATAASTEILDIDQRLNELQVRRVPGASPERPRSVPGASPERPRGVCGACAERVRSVCGACAERVRRVDCRYKPRPPYRNGTDRQPPNIVVFAVVLAAPSLRSAKLFPSAQNFLRAAKSGKLPLAGDGTAGTTAPL